MRRIPFTVRVPRVRLIGAGVLAAALAGGVPARAQVAHAPPPLIGNVIGRTTTSLNGSWRTIVDPFETGYYTYRWTPDPNGFFRDRRPSSPAERVEYDFDRSPALLVPGDWNSQRPELLLYEGTVWYRRSFEYQLRRDRRLYVHFGAANYEARVWLNGRELGVHEGGFTPFNFELTEHLRPGINQLIVKVDNKRRPDAVPTVNADWWNYGGITRDVLLIETPRTFVRDYLLQLDPGDPTRVAGWLQLDGPEPATPVTVRIPEAGLEQEVIPDRHGRASVVLDARGLERWSPERPRLYDIRLTTAHETLTDRIGFRTIETRGTRILLNGEPIFLRGISIHEEAPTEARRAHGREDARTLLGWVKELNGNFARLAHYPHDEAMVRMADELGILIWAEVPVYWTIQWENPGTLASARRQLGELIARDRNRAAVALWSVANETPRDRASEGGPRLRFLRELIGHVRALDPSRLVTAALEHHYEGRHTIVIDDPLGSHLDVLGNNEYIGWYDGAPEKADSVEWRSAFGKPLVMSEFGAGARQGLHGSREAVWTEEYQERVYRHQVAMLARIPFLAGASPWILRDFRSPRRPLPDIQDYFNRKGLLSERGEKKRAFFVLQSFYATMRSPPATLVPVGEGWAGSSVNAVIFRGHSLFTHDSTQYAAWYDGEGRMLLGRRRLGGTRWEVRPSQYRGNVRDAHNAISIAVDGRGVLHVAWDHHGQPLNYARGVAPGSLELTDRLPATGLREREVTYPQFTVLPDGGLLLTYRDGGSGRGDVLLSRYDVVSGRWRAVQHPLLAGEGARNAYPNPLVVDGRGHWHLSWTWRETPDVVTNHDVLYAWSPDEGQTWLTSAGAGLRLPITGANAEVAWRVPQGSGLINQTSMTTDAAGRPLIATYWRPAGSEVPQYQLVRFTGREWRASQVGQRRLAFRLEGEGTRRIPVSRPLVLSDSAGAVYMIFRDLERGGGITVACSLDAARSEWRFRELDERSVGLWEPTHDPVAWAQHGRLHLFHQRVGQGEGETLEDLPPQPVSVLEWRPECGGNR